MLNPILNKYMKARYLNQFVSEMFNSWKQDSAWYALRYAIINYATMATYSVPDLPILEAVLPSFGIPFSYFFRDALFVRSSKHVNVLGRPAI